MKKKKNQWIGLHQNENIFAFTKTLLRKGKGKAKTRKRNCKIDI